MVGTSLSFSDYSSLLLQDLNVFRAVSSALWVGIPIFFSLFYASSACFWEACRETTLTCCPLLCLFHWLAKAVSACGGSKSPHCMLTIKPHLYRDFLTQLADQARPHQTDSALFVWSLTSCSQADFLKMTVLFILANSILRKKGTKKNVVIVLLVWKCFEQGMD